MNYKHGQNDMRALSILRSMRENKRAVDCWSDIVQEKGSLVSAEKCEEWVSRKEHYQKEWESDFLKLREIKGKDALKFWVNHGI